MASTPLCGLQGGRQGGRGAQPPAQVPGHRQLPSAWSWRTCVCGAWHHQIKVGEDLRDRPEGEIGDVTQVLVASKRCSVPPLFWSSALQSRGAAFALRCRRAAERGGGFFSVQAAPREPRRARCIVGLGREPRSREEAEGEEAKPSDRSAEKP